MNLFDAATKGATVRRLGDLSLVAFGSGRGSMLVGSQDFLQARKWAQQKTSSGNENRDLQLLLGRLELYVTRYGSGFPAKGHPNRLLRLARDMQALGLNHEDWTFPRQVADELRKKPHAVETSSESKPDSG